jgi:hypothetical protein
MAIPQLSSGVLLQALAAESWGTPITLQVLGELWMGVAAPPMRSCVPVAPADTVAADHALCFESLAARCLPALSGIPTTVTTTTCPTTCPQAEVQHIKPKDGGTGPARTKVIVSDGVYKCTALLASQLKDAVDEGKLVQWAIVNVTELVGNKKLNQANKK